MKKIMGLLVFCFAIVFSTTAVAQNTAQKEVEQKVQQLTKAMIDGDSAALDKLAADNLIYRHSSGHIDTKKDFVHKLASGESDFVTIDITDPTVSVINKNVVVVWHTLSAKTNDGGKPGEVNLYIMLVWEKQKGQWKLVARQAAKKL